MEKVSSIQFRLIARITKIFIPYICCHTPSYALNKLNIWKIMYNNLEIEIEVALKAYLAVGVEEQVDYPMFYIYSIVPHSKNAY